MKAYEIESQTDFRQRELTTCQAEYKSTGNCIDNSIGTSISDH